jgi:hypothetical protein
MRDLSYYRKWFSGESVGFTHIEYIEFSYRYIIIIFVAPVPPVHYDTVIDPRS